MRFALVTTRHFEHRARKFLRKHPDLRPTLRDTLNDLGQDPFQPKLKLQPLSGNLAGLQVVSLTFSYRLTFDGESHRTGNHPARHRQPRRSLSLRVYAKEIEHWAAPPCGAAELDQDQDDNNIPRKHSVKPTPAVLRSLPPTPVYRTANPARSRRIAPPERPTVPGSPPPPPPPSGPDHGPWRWRR